ncbi:MAG: ATP-dependent DNA ligase [Anaeromyxobacteraceae bacterium]
MLLAEIAAASRAVAETPSRLEKIARLADLLARLAPAEAPVALPWLTGALRQGRIGVAGALLRAAVAASRPAAAPSLAIRDGAAAWSRLAGGRGAGSQGERRHLLSDLLGRATEPERDFLARLLFGELRQGALEGVLEAAVARASGAAPADLRRAAMVAGDLAPVAAAALAGGPAALAAFRLRLLEPIQPMLAQTADGVDDALGTLGEAAFDAKLDGMRVQVHRDGDEVRVFTRSLRDVTAALPEVASAALALPARRLVLDGEALAFDAAGVPHPFQVSMRRLGRKGGAAALSGDLPVRALFFDALHLDGEDLVARAARERLTALEAALPPALVVPRVVTADPLRARAFLDEVLRAGHEGVVAKALDAPYEAGQRGKGWLKVKPAHTLDLVVLAAERGHGRRAGWLSNLHLGARDPATGGLVMLGKTFKGLTDAMLAWQTERLSALAVADDGFTVQVRPELVVEVAFDGVQASPRYPGGVARRVARVKRHRDDKRPEEADTIETVRALHRPGPADAED